VPGELVITSQPRWREVAQRVRAGICGNSDLVQPALLGYAVDRLVASVCFRPESDITARRNLRHMALSDARIAPVQECIPRDLAVAETAVVVAPVQ